MSDQTQRSPAVLGVPGRNAYHLDRTRVDMSRPAQPVRRLEAPGLPQAVVLDLAKTALIVVDMQNEFCSTKGWLSVLGQDVSGAAALVGPIKRLADALRESEVPVIWLNWGIRPDRLNLSPGAQHTFNQDGCSAGLGDLLAANGEAGHKILEKGSWGAAIVEALAPAADDVFVDKHRISGFWDSPLDSILRNLQVTTLLFAGINADQCVYATLMDANFAGYDTIMVEDCVATTSPAFCLEATLYNVRFAYGFTVKSADLIQGLGR